MAREFTRVGVVGLGTMGAGISRCSPATASRSSQSSATSRPCPAASGTSRRRPRVRSSAASSLRRRSRRSSTGSRSPSSLEDLADCHLVVEAVPEKLELKQQIFAELDRITAPDAILATNTSSLSVTEISVATHRPAQVVGMHFFNPAPVLKLVEVIRTVVTDAQVIDDVKALGERLGKVPVVVGDKAGFIANALLFGYLNHAAAMYEQRYASREDIDAAMKLGCGLPMGPLALLDLIGLDTAYEILDTMYKQTRDRLHAPAPIIKQMVTAGVKGRKTGRGFYTYEAPDSPVVVADAQPPSPNGDGPDGPSRATGRRRRLGNDGGRDRRGLRQGRVRRGAARAGHRADRQGARLHRRSLEKAVVRGKITEAERDAALGTVQWQHLVRRPRRLRPRSSRRRSKS